MKKCNFRPSLLASLFIPVVAVALPAVAGSMNQSGSPASTDSQQNGSNANAWEHGTHSMQSRLDRLWNALDTNGDGQISRAEFDAHRQLLASALRPMDGRAMYTRAAGQPISQVQAIRASRLIGVDVTNPQGDDLGEIRDLLIDVHDGRIRYAVLDYGGMLNVGDNLFAVPISAFRPTADGSGLIVNIDNDKLEHAPSFARDQWPDFNSSDYTSRVDRYYASHASSESQTSNAAQPRHEGSWPHASGALWRVSRLIGKDVDNKQGDDVGQINDLVVNMRNGRVRYVLLQYDKPSSLEAERWAVPIAALDFNSTHHDVVLNASPEQMDTSRALGNADVTGYPVAVEQYWLVLVPTANAASANAENNGATSSQPGTSAETTSPSMPSNETSAGNANATSSSEQGEANATSPSDNTAAAATQGSQAETAQPETNAQQNANRRLPAAGGGNGGNTENGATSNGASDNGSNSNSSSSNSSDTSGATSSGTSTTTSSGTTSNGTTNNGASSNGTASNGTSANGTSANGTSGSESNTSNGNNRSVQ